MGGRKYRLSFLDCKKGRFEHVRLNDHGARPESRHGLFGRIQRIGLTLPFRWLCPVSIEYAVRNPFLP